MDSKFNILSTIVAFVVNVICVKIMIIFSSNDVYSLWNLINSYATIILVLISINLTHYLGLSLAVKKIGLNKKFVQFMIISLIVMCTIITIVLHIFNVEYMLVVISISVSRYIYNIVKTVYLFTKQMKRFFIYELLIGITKIIIICIFTYYNYVLLGFVIAFSIPLVLFGIIYLLRSNVKYTSSKYIGNYQVLLICIPLLINGFIFTLLQNFDKIILNNNGYFSFISYYAVIYVFFILGTTIITTFNSIIAPTFYEKLGNRVALKGEIKMFQDVFWFFIFLFLIFSKPIIVILYDDSFLVVNNLVPLILLASIFYYYYISYSNNLLVENKTVPLTFIVSISLSTNIVLNLLLINTIGPIGSIISLVISYVIMGSLAFIYVRKLISKSKLNSRNEIRLMINYFTYFIILCILSYVGNISSGLIVSILMVLIVTYFALKNNVISSCLKLMS